MQPMRKVELDVRVSALDWSPDGEHLAIGAADGSVAVIDLEGAQEWCRKEHRELVSCVRFSPDGELLASCSDDQTVRVRTSLDGETQHLWSCGAQVWSADFSPDSSRLLIDEDLHACLFDVATGELLGRCAGHIGPVLTVAFSPDGQTFATGSHDGTVRLWDAEDLREVAIFNTVAEARALAFSPDGKSLTAGDEDGNLFRWEPQEGTAAEEPALASPVSGAVLALKHSPDGQILACGGEDKQIHLLDSRSGQDLAKLESPSRLACHLAFSPDGEILAHSAFGQTVYLWRVTTALGLGDPEASSRDLESWAQRQAASADGGPRLADAYCALFQLGLSVPLAHVRELLHLTSSTPSAAASARAPGLARLASLRWQTSARVGLVALLLRHAPVDPSWQPPSGTSPVALREALVEALTSIETASIETSPIEKMAGDEETVDVPPLPSAAIARAADRVDDRLLTLLAAIGPKAVAADPGLPLRLLPHVAEIPPLAEPERRLLALHLDLGAGGAAQGQGLGTEISGLSTQGDLRTLLPSQLALPPTVLAGRHLRGELLYRARRGRELPRLRPSVLLLDVSPPTFGPVESVTRLAAHAIASSLLDAGLGVVLLTAGGEGTVRVLEQRADLVSIWTPRTLEPADPVRALRAARALREQLAEGPVEPVVILLSQTFFGADEIATEELLPEVASLRGLFVRYPGQRETPPLARRCERWVALEPRPTPELAVTLGRLMG